MKKYMSQPQSVLRISAPFCMHMCGLAMFVCNTQLLSHLSEVTMSMLYLERHASEGCYTTGMAPFRKLEPWLVAPVICEGTS